MVRNPALQTYRHSALPLGAPLGGVLAVLIVALAVAPASGGAAVVPRFPGATAYSLSAVAVLPGSCAHGFAAPGHWSNITGLGGVRSSAHAKPCPAFRGGPANFSQAGAGSWLESIIPVSVRAGSGGANVSLTFSYRWNVTLNLSSYSCPGVKTSTTLGTGNGTYRYTEIRHNCPLNASVLGGAAAALANGSNASTFRFIYSSNDWSFPTTYVRVWNCTDRYWVNYTSPGPGRMNYSSFASYHGSTPTWSKSGSGTATLQFFTNATFRAAGVWQLYVGIVVKSNTVAYGYSGVANAFAAFDGARPPGGFNVTGVTVW